MNVYGFHVSKKQGAMYHYYDPCDLPQNLGRDGKEFGVVKSLYEMGVINFVEDCVFECHGTAEECERCKREKKFKPVPMKSDKHCNPCRSSEGHHFVPWGNRKPTRNRPCNYKGRWRG